MTTPSNSLPNNNNNTQNINNNNNFSNGASSGSNVPASDPPNITSFATNNNNNSSKPKSSNFITVDEENGGIDYGEIGAKTSALQQALKGTTTRFEATKKDQQARSKNALKKARVDDTASSSEEGKNYTDEQRHISNVAYHIAGQLFVQNEVNKTPAFVNNAQIKFAHPAVKLLSSNDDFAKVFGNNAGTAISFNIGNILCHMIDDDQGKQFKYLGIRVPVHKSHNINYSIVAPQTHIDIKSSSKLDFIHFSAKCLIETLNVQHLKFQFVKQTINIVTALRNDVNEEWRFTFVKHTVDSFKYSYELPQIAFDIIIELVSKITSLPLSESAELFLEMVSFLNALPAEADDFDEATGYTEDLRSAPFITFVENIVDLLSFNKFIGNANANCPFNFKKVHITTNEKFNDNVANVDEAMTLLVCKEASEGQPMKSTPFLQALEEAKSAGQVAATKRATGEDVPLLAAATAPAAPAVLNYKNAVNSYPQVPVQEVLVTGPIVAELKKRGVPEECLPILALLTPKISFEQMRDMAASQQAFIGKNRQQKAASQAAIVSEDNAPASPAVEESQKQSVPENEKSENEKSENEKTQNEKIQNEKTQNEKTQNEKTQNEKTQNEKTQKEKIPQTVFLYKIYENYKGLGALHYGEHGVLRALAESAKHVIYFNQVEKHKVKRGDDEVIEETVHRYVAFIGLTFEDRASKKDGPVRCVPTKRVHITSRDQVAKHYTDLKARKDFGKGNSVNVTLQGPPAVINKLRAEHKLEAYIKAVNEKGISADLHTIRAIIPVDKYNALLAIKDKTFLIQDRRPLLNDDEIFQKNSATIKLNRNFTLKDIYAFASKFYDKYGATSTLMSGALRVYFTKNNLEWKHVEEIRKMEGVFNFLTDTKIVRPWSAEDNAAKNERLLKRRAENTLTPEALLQQQKEKKQQQQERNKDAAAADKKENKYELVPNARKVIALDLMTLESWEAVAKHLNAKFEVSLTNPENAILTWNTEEEANKYELGTTFEKEEEGLAILFSAALYKKKQ
jgi:hypothetical protein